MSEAAVKVIRVVPGELGNAILADPVIGRHEPAQELGHQYLLRQRGRDRLLVLATLGQQ